MRAPPLEPLRRGRPVRAGSGQRALKGGVEIGGKTYAVNFVLKDTQSDPVTGSKVAKELIPPTRSIW